MFGLNNRIHYPRTYHLPWSEGLQNDDRRIESLDGLRGKDVVVTVKLDGENTTMYRDAIHARSLDVVMTHPSRTWVRALHGAIAHDIPEGWRVCGENVYAKHSIVYDSLPSYFFVFSIWNEKNESLSWDETKEWAALLGLLTVPVAYKGKWEDFVALGPDWRPSPVYGEEVEGYVVRVADKFHFDDFSTHMAKYVRKGHIQPGTEHWTKGYFAPNKLTEK